MIYSNVSFPNDTSVFFGVYQTSFFLKSHLSPALELSNIFSSFICWSFISASAALCNTRMLTKATIIYR